MTATWYQVHFDADRPPTLLESTNSHLPCADSSHPSFVGGSLAAFLMLQHAQHHVESLGTEAGDVTLAAERPTGPGRKQIPRVSSMLFDLEVLIRLPRSLC